MHFDLVFSILNIVGNNPFFTKIEIPCALDFCFKENISKFGNSIAGMFSVLVSHRQPISNFETYSGKMSKRNLLVIPQTFKVKKEILENVGIFDLGFSKVFLLLCFSLLMPNLPHQNFG